MLETLPIESGITVIPVAGTWNDADVGVIPGVGVAVTPVVGVVPSDS
jgi:hypothetical protein